MLIERLARNRPLPDGNKRTAFSLTLEFLAANGRPFSSADTDVDATTVERVAAGELDHDEIVAWIRIAPERQQARRLSTGLEGRLPAGGAPSD